MSRRYSDAPINLIARIPTPEQMSAARPKQRSLSQVVMEFGAACVRGMAEMAAQVRRLGYSIGSSVSGPAGGVSLGLAGKQVARIAQSLAESVRLCYARVAKIATSPSAQVPLVQSTEKSRESVVVQAATAVPVESPRFVDVESLRLELSSQRQEVARLSAQLQELKAFVGSQQQVLVYLGQELESQQKPVMSAAAQAAPPAKKARVARAKPVSKTPSVLRSASREPSLNL